jgi:hypothetical protein
METMNISKSTPVYEPSTEVFAEPNDGNGTIVLYVIILIVVMVIVAHYAGFNVLSYLGKGVDAVGNKVLPIWETILIKLGYKTEESVKHVAHTSASATGQIGKDITEQSDKVKKATSAASDVEHSDDEEDIDPVDTNQVNGNKKTKPTSSSTANSEKLDANKKTRMEQNEHKVNTSELKKKIGSPQPTRAELEKLDNDNVKPTDSYDAASSKKGWCLIGSYEGIRSCSNVGEADMCMSGDIFPSQDMCVNPNVRS